MKKLLNLIMAITLVAAVGVLSIGCNALTTPTTNQPAARGNLQVLITDAPPKPEVTGVELTVSKIEVHKAGLDELATVTPTATISTTPTETVTPTTTAPTTTEPTGDNSWITLNITGPQTFDLLHLKGIEAAFASQSLEAGKYTQVRLTVDKAMVKLGTDDVAKEATLPSGVLKFVHPFEIKAGETTAILMDFIAEESVDVNSNNNKITVKPVVKLTTKEDKPAEKAAPVKVAGLVLSGGDTTAADAPQDAPRIFAYTIQKEDNTQVIVKYTAYPPSPAGDAAMEKITLTFYQSPIAVGDYMEAQGEFDQTTNTVTVVNKGDYIKTYAQKP